MTDDSTKREGSGSGRRDDATKREGSGSSRPDPASTRREGAGKREVSFSSEEAGAPIKAEYLARGTTVGRYVVLDVLGEGGMGVVYSAFDPELDRKVAIKLLQTMPGGSSGGDKAWLVREAQALARLSHPNVVAVHDVGTLAGDRVFVAMELVDGETLRDWLKEKPRGWREVVPLMLAAGAGLAAAHRAELVHRDFKPDNVIVGKDGRVRVMDFGLARLHRDGDHIPTRRDSDLSIESRSPLSEKLTIAGTVVGTPAYMAPEIYTGEPADARTDQFAFGVALYEALYRARPYERKDLMPPVSAPKPKTPPEIGVPAQIQRVVMRAISIDRTQRYASMDELLTELAVDPTARRRRIVGGTAIIALAGLALGGVYTMKRGRTSHLCTGAEARLDGVWDDHARQTTKAAFEATKKPFASQSYAGLARALDRYTGEWTHTVTDSCEATRIRGEQSEDVMSLRDECLSLRLDELRAMVPLLETAEGSVVDKGDKVVQELEPVAKCNNVIALREPNRPPPELRPQILALEQKLAAAKAQVIAGRYLPALVATKTTGDEAAKLGFEPIVADALLARGAALTATGNNQGASDAFSDATWAAVRSKRDDVASVASLMTAKLTADLGNPDKARVWLALSRATSSRAGVDHTVEIHRLEIEGMVDAAAGDLNAAVASHEKALAAAMATYSPSDPLVATDEQLLATTFTKIGAFGKAMPHYEHALTLLEASLGPDHPDVGMLLSNLGVCYRHLHEAKKSRAAFDRALALRERTYGKSSPMLIATLDNMAELLAQEGDFDGSIATFDRAMTIAAVVPGKAHAMYHGLATDRAEVLIDIKRYPDARAALDELMDLETSSHSATLPQTQAVRAKLALAEHAWADAANFAQLSITGYETLGGKDNPALWRPLTWLAEARIGLTPKSPGDARTELERAIAIGEKSQVTPDDLAPTRALLARLSRP